MLCTYACIVPSPENTHCATTTHAFHLNNAPLHPYAPSPRRSRTHQYRNHHLHTWSSMLTPREEHSPTALPTSARDMCKLPDTQQPNTKISSAAPILSQMAQYCCSSPKCRKPSLFVLQPIIGDPAYASIPPLPVIGDEHHSPNLLVRLDATYGSSSLPYAELACRS